MQRRRQSVGAEQPALLQNTEPTPSAAAGREHCDPPTLLSPGSRRVLCGRDFLCHWPLTPVSMLHLHSYRTG